MSIRLVYDISYIAKYLDTPKYHNGLYRYATDLFHAFSKRPDLELYLAHSSYPRYINNAGKFLRPFGLETRLTSKRVSRLPRNFLGRAEQYFNMAYKYLGIDVEKLSYNHDVYAKADAFLSPYPPMPACLDAFRGLKKVLTIHDVIPLLDPGFSPEIRRSLDDTIRSAGNGYAICVSNHTRNDLLNMYSNIDPAKVFVSYLAADPSLFYRCTSQTKFAEVQARYGLPDRYMLSLCMLEPRKNLDHLVRCFIRIVKEQHIDDLSLVLIGSSDWDISGMIPGLQAAGSIGERIIFTGRVPDHDLATIYSHAQAFFFMSKYEGFGLPPLEAMQCGTPTVTSNATSLPEVVGDGGIMLAPDDEDGLCHAMYQLYNNPGLREEYSKKGLKRAGEFSWDRCAGEHINIFKTIAQ